MKKILSVILALTIALAMVACGKKSEDVAKDRIGTAETGMEFYVAIAEDGSKTVVDKSGAAAEGFTLDASGNIVDKDGQIIVAADKVQQLPTVEAKPNESSEPSSGSGDSSSVPSGTGTGSEAKSNTGSAGNGSSGSKVPSGTGSSGSSGSSAGSGSSGSTPATPDPKPAHQHSWQAVYRTVETPVYKDICFTYCAYCDAKWNAYYPQYSCSEDMYDHMAKHIDAGEGGRTYENGIPEHIQTGTTTAEVLDHYVCSCGETKSA